MAEVRGMAFLGLLRTVKRTFGEARLATALEGASDTTRLMSSERIRHFGWYPYSGFAGFLRSVDRELGKGDGSLTRKLGEEAARWDLKDRFDALSGATAEQLIKACGPVWDAYYRDAGRMEAITWSPENTVLRILDFPEMVPEHCRLMEGWMIAAMETIGALVAPDAHEPVCCSRGAAYHEFWCRWSLRER